MDISQYEFEKDDTSFVIKSGKNDICNGAVMDSQLVADYYDSIKNSSDMKILEKQDKDDYSYIFYELKSSYGIEHNYIIKFKSSSADIMLASLYDRDTAEDVFDSLSFERA